MDLIVIGASSGSQLDELATLTYALAAQPHADGGWRLENARNDAETRTQVDAWCQARRLDHAYIPPRSRLSDFTLLAMDMDSTLVTIETIDEIADYCGRKREVAAITEAAMRGEITDYSESLRRRVALLEGLETSALERVYEERMRLSPGAQRLIHEAHDAGLSTLLVSGGFTFFTERLRERLRLTFAKSNTLGIRHGRLTGEVVGEIVDASVKARTVLDVCAQLGITADRAIAIGDGANDLKMMHAVGLSVAYRAKPVVRAQASMAFDFCGLDGLLAVLPR
ncbi:MAG TPA: phosphoserine phosphatase SerB [Burkholderiaceae bacterium]|nr:phosphoserine phosphatase SerB [Burkholderiaceae bacterium]